MYIIKDKTNEIIAISDTLDYQENGNPLIDNGARAIAEILVGSIEESDIIPEGWECSNGIYNQIREEEDIISLEEKAAQLEQENAILKSWLEDLKVE